MEKDIIGINCNVSIGDHDKIPAKVDTGADSSAIWASNLSFCKNYKVLKFTLFNESSQFYTGKVFETTNFRVVIVKSSNGLSEMRFKVQLSIKINKRKIKAWFTLSNRENNRFPILIGRRALSGKFLVDPSINNLKQLAKTNYPDLSDSLTNAEFDSIINEINKQNNEEFNINKISVGENGYDNE